jgi:hypothetical protein
VSNQLFDSKAFGQRVAARLAWEHLSYREAQIASGVDHAVIHRISRGKPPSVENYLRLLRWLDSGQVDKNGT